MRVSKWQRPLTLLAVVGIVLAVAQNWDSFQVALGDFGPRGPLASLFIGLGLLGGARSWWEVVPEPARESAFVGYITAQPAKYLPVGGVAQAISQVGYSTRVRSDRTSLTISWFVHGSLQVSAAGALGAITVWGATPDGATWLVIGLAAIGSIGILWLIQPSRLNWLLGRIGGTLGTAARSGVVPQRAQLLRALVWTLFPLVMSGVGMVVLSAERADLIRSMGMVGAYALAWAVGYIVIPLPSGVGAREFVLVGLLHWIEPGAVIALSVVHRVATLVAELVVFALAIVLLRRRREEV